MQRIAVTASLKALPGKRDELIRLCREYVPLFVEREREILRIELLLPPDDPDTLVLWEVYESADVLAAHRNGELLKKFKDSIKGLLQSMSSTSHALLE